MATIFLSYCNSDSDLADIIERTLNSAPNIDVTITRYSRDVHYRESFKEFMRTINDHDFVFAIVSDAYLKSPACMFEIGEIVNSRNFSERILFVVVTEEDRKYYSKSLDEIAANVYNPLGRIGYVSYWKNYYDTMKNKINEIDDDVAKLTFAAELRRIAKIKDYDCGEFMLYLADAKGVSLSSLITSDFRDVINLIRPLSEHYHGILSYEALFRKTLMELRALTKCNCNQIILYCVTNTHATGLSVFADAISSSKPHYRLVVATSLIYKAFNSGHVINVPDVINDRDYFPAIAETASELVIPIGRDRTICGVFNAESELINHFNDVNIPAVQSILYDFLSQLFIIGYSKNSSMHEIPYVPVTVDCKIGNLLLSERHIAIIQCLDKDESQTFADISNETKIPEVDLLISCSELLQNYIIRKEDQKYSLDMKIKLNIPLMQFFGY